MSLADTPDAQQKTSKPARKRFRRILSGLLVCVVLLGGLTAAMRSARPSWHVVTGSGKPGEWVGTMECPDNWQLVTQSSRPNFTILTLRRKPLTGPMAWWNRVILHQAGEGSITRIIVCVAPEIREGMLPAPPMSHADKLREANTSLDTIASADKSAMQNTPGRKMTIQRLSHPLGPALAEAMDKATPIQTGTALPGSTIHSDYDSLIIVPTEAGDFRGMVTVGSLTSPSEAAALKPILERMTRSIRLVKK